MRSEREKQREATRKVIGKESFHSRGVFRPLLVKTDQRTARGVEASELTGITPESSWTRAGAER